LSARLTVRMMAPTAAISVLLLGVGVVAAWHVHRTRQNIPNTLQVNVSSTRATDELEILAWEVRTHLHPSIMTGGAIEAATSLTVQGPAGRCSRCACPWRRAERGKLCRECRSPGAGRTCRVKWTLPACRTSPK
jgi:hypothetical protein